MQKREPIVLELDCEALQVPSGAKLQLKKGELVTLTQDLGGNYTVIMADGNMARIANEHASALGRSPREVPTLDAKDINKENIEKYIWEELKTCYDPEIPVNIVDLGLIYHLDVSPSVLDPNVFSVLVRMTLTAPGCGMGEVLTQEAKNKIERLPGVKEVEVELVFDPPWAREMMSEAARLELGLM